MPFILLLSALSLGTLREDENTIKGSLSFDIGVEKIEGLGAAGDAIAFQVAVDEVLGRGYAVGFRPYLGREMALDEFVGVVVTEIVQRDTRLFWY